MVLLSITAFFITNIHTPWVMLLYIDKDGSLRYGAGALDDCYVIGFAAIEVYSFGCTEQRIVATLQSQTNKANK